MKMTSPPVSSCVWFIERLGSIENLYMKETQLPELNCGQVRVCVKAIGLNFADVFQCLGLYAAAPKSNFIPGLEFCGIIEEVGPADPSHPVQFRKNDRVMGVSKFGAFASRINIESIYLKRLPSTWTFEQGASYMVQGLTALYGLSELGNIQPNSTVLVHSAAGGVGLLALQIIKKYGGKAIATVGGDSKKEFLSNMFENKFNSEGHQDLEIIVRTTAKEFDTHLTNAETKLGVKGIDISFDSLGGDYFRIGYDHLAGAGRLIAFGAGSLMPNGNLGFNIFQWAKLGYGFWKRPKIDPTQMIGDNKSVMGFNLIYMYDNISKFNNLYEKLESLGLDPPHVGKVFKYKDMKEALYYFQSGASVGKVVVSLEE
eukprot:Sdes_comp18091_c0_seq1m7515